MTLGDWSSDVCSSDLFTAGASGEVTKSESGSAPEPKSEAKPKSEPKPSGLKVSAGVDSVKVEAK